VDQFGALAAVGVQHVIFSMANAWDLHNFETLDRAVLPQVHALEPTAI
jgi:hypothetical protein